MIITFFSGFILLTISQQCKSQDFTCCDGSVRLVNGTLSNEGRVELCVSGQWKTVCDNNWSMNETQVVCRQLGYSDQDATPLLSAAHGVGSGMIVEQVRCNGTERRLTDCTIRDSNDGVCSHNEDAGVRCSCRSGDLRLQGSIIQGRGRVEVCVNNVWGTVCDDSWTSADTTVVCRQLGFSRFGGQYSCCAAYGRGSGSIHMDNVRCAGNESSLVECPHISRHNCGHHEDVSVQCQTSIACYDGDVRLRDGSQSHKGRVEICFNETWGTICNEINPWYGWNQSEANVVCKQLGYSGANSSSFGFGRGSLRINIRNVYCKGTESSLAQCSFSASTSSSCSYSSAVAVSCIFEHVGNGELRLVDGLSEYDGRLEIRWNSEWRSICADGWNEDDVIVVCRQLNYLSTSIEVEALSYEEDIRRRPLLLLTNVGCSGTENNFTNCCATDIQILNGSLRQSCHSRQYAGVRCGQCMENSVRLVGELAKNEGFVAICHGGRWGKVCDAWIDEARVICRQLGFSTESEYSKTKTKCMFKILIMSIYIFTVDPGLYYYRNYNSFQYGLPIVINYIQCSSNETQLSECNFSSSSSSSYWCYRQFGVRCEIAEENVPGAPLNVQVSNIQSSMINLSWSPPPFSQRFGLTFFNYIVNCSTAAEYNTQDNSVIQTDRLNAVVSNLRPLTHYKCCIMVNSTHGRGEPACRDTFTSYTSCIHSASSPSQLQSTIINSTTLLLSWHAPKSNTSFANCSTAETVREYNIEATDDSMGVQITYNTIDTHLFIETLEPNHLYTFRVAANYYTIGMGPYSQPVNITLNSPEGLEIDSYSSNSVIESHSIGTPTYILSSILGLATIALFVSIIIAICLGYRLFKFKRNKKSDRPSAQVPVYEMVNLPSQSDYSGQNEHYFDRETHSVWSNSKLKEAHDAQEYMTPVIQQANNSGRGGRNINVSYGNRAEVPTMKPDEDNTYQPLILPRSTLSDDSKVYQSLTLPKAFNIPPTLPPKPQAKCTVKRAQSNVQRGWKEN